MYFCKPFRSNIIGIISLLSFCTTGIHAQFRNYSIVYTDNAKGNIAMFGNTLMAIVDNSAINTAKMNDNAADGNSSFGNDFENMQYVDVDGNGFTGIATRNSSTADFTLPAGTNTIKLARLYWGGRVKDSEFDLSLPANKKIKLRKGTFLNYTEFTATQIDRNNFIQNNEAYTRYQAFADITSFIQTNGTGTYSVGNAPLSIGAIDNGGNYGGWCIVIVYENPSLNYSSIRLYDGFQEVFNNGNPLTTSVTLTGLNVPSSPLAAGDAKMGAVTWEGDANLTGDFLKINGNTFSNAINPANNPWNGTISDNGLHITTKNPNYTNQMGIDIDQFDVSTGYGILPNATTAGLEFGTEADQYFPGIFSFVIKMKEPTITLDKSVADANNNGKAEVGEVLTYNLKGVNTGAGNANKVLITDTLPNTVTYLPTSLRVISSPGITSGFKTDAAGDDIAEFILNGAIQTVQFRLGTGANSIDGGVLAANETYEVEFKVTVNNPGSGRPVPSIINTARIKATSDANVDFTDDGTAIINPEAGALPVILLYFNTSLQQNKKVNITWATSMEINCKYFDVERSIDGNLFTTVATLPGNGTTSLVHTYAITDEITALTSPVVYYRLKQVDLDGKKNYSQISAVRLRKDNRQLIVSPNPFNTYININVEWTRNEAVMVKILNAQGKETVRKMVQFIKGTNFIRLDDLLKLQAGNYFIEIASAAEKLSQNILKK
ncbi:MAG: hypothetical protein JWO92_929 [Chitinophagaceae bacterium]|nr:hypothetical protein [Chitinophagaceae bacterium]